MLGHILPLCIATCRIRYPSTSTSCQGETAARSFDGFVTLSSNAMQQRQLFRIRSDDRFFTSSYSLGETVREASPHLILKPRVSLIKPPMAGSFYLRSGFFINRKRFPLRGFTSLPESQLGSFVNSILRTLPVPSCYSLQDSLFLDGVCRDWGLELRRIHCAYRMIYGAPLSLSDREEAVRSNIPYSLLEV